MHEQVVHDEEMDDDHDEEVDEDHHEGEQQ